MFDLDNVSSGNPSFARQIADVMKQTRVNGPAPMAFSPNARALGDLAGEAGASVRNPMTVLQEQQAHYGTPTDPHDPRYRMGMGHRILGTLANFANGFAGNHASPIYVGPGALNNRYYQDERLRQQNLENVNRQLAEAH